jgi:hypothetical protein
MEIEDLVTHLFVCNDCVHHYHDQCKGKTCCDYCSIHCQCLICERVIYATQKEK